MCFFTRIAASNTASDDVNNWVTHIIFNTDLPYSCSHFVFKIDEKYITLMASFITIY